MLQFDPHVDVEDYAQRLEDRRIGQICHLTGGNLEAVSNLSSSSNTSALIEAH